jgi:catechol 2,3-dioxygenase
LVAAPIEEAGMGEEFVKPMSTYTLHPETKLGPVHLTVSDMARSLGFYRDVLGFRLLDQSADRVSLTADGVSPILLLTELPGARAGFSRNTGLYHFAVLYPERADLARALKRLWDSGYPLGGCSDHSVSEALYLDDPDGNGIELYRDQPRSAWPMRDGKVSMTTDPLDLDDLLGEAASDGAEGEGPWDGLPKGASIGHIHLHVVDLEESAAFYRDALGFEVQARYRQGALFLSAGGYHHHLGINVWAERMRSPQVENVAGLRSFAVCVPDAAELDRIDGQLEAAGAAFTRKDGAIFVDDPSENTVILQGGRPTGGL